LKGLWGESRVRLRRKSVEGERWFRKKEEERVLGCRKLRKGRYCPAITVGFGCKGKEQVMGWARVIH
jgi:hypothetical protein